MITIHFTKPNTVYQTAVYLNVNQKGAKPIYIDNAITSISNQIWWVNDSSITFRYDTNIVSSGAFVLVDHPRTYMASCSVASGAGVKVVTIPGCVICNGTVLEIYMSNNNTATSPVLKIDGT